MDAERADETAVSLEGVRKCYPTATALDGLSLTVRRGERVAVLGPSGGGKTTLLHTIAGIVRPDSGTVSLSGRPFTTIRPGAELASLVGVIHQQFDLVPHLSVANNVLAGALGRRGLVRSLVSLVRPIEIELALAALERVGIGDRSRERTAGLSGGQQQRVAIARLLVQDPEVMLADEPVASLDPSRAADVMRLLSDIALAEGKTLICSVHTVDLVRSFFDRVVGLSDGATRFDVAVEDLTDGHLTELYWLRSAETAGT